MAEIVNYGEKQTAALQITTGLYPSTATPLDIRTVVRNLDILQQPYPVGCKLYEGLRIYVEDPPQTVTVIGKQTGADGSLWNHWIFDTILPQFKQAIDESYLEERYSGLVKVGVYTPENLLNYLFLRCHGTQIITHKVTITYNIPNSEPTVREHQYAEGEDYNISSIPVTGYTPNPATVSGTMGTEDVTYTVNYSINSYYLKYWRIDTSDPEPFESYTLNYHASATVPSTNPSRTGFSFLGWTYTPQLASGGLMPASNVNATARWEQVINRYEIEASANPSNGGTVSGDGEYNEGATCTLSATANSGFTFANWSKDGDTVSTNSTYSFTVTERASYVATFNAMENTLSLSVETTPSAEPGGSVSGAGTYTHGQSVTAIATTNTGYIFNGWWENGSKVSTNLSYTFTLNSNRTLVAKFIKQITISTSSDPVAGGSTSGGGTRNYGESFTITAAPNEGYSFVNWTKDGSTASTSAEYTFTPTESATYVANFYEIPKVKVYALNTDHAMNVSDLQNIDWSQEASVQVLETETSGSYRVHLNDLSGVSESSNRRWVVVAIPSSFDKGTPAAYPPEGSGFFMATSIVGQISGLNNWYSTTSQINNTSYLVVETTQLASDTDWDIFFGNTEGMSYQEAMDKSTLIPLGLNLGQM